jgi:thienamycin biosynthesis protein ThnN
MTLTAKRVERTAIVADRVHEVLALHLHPRHGSTYWLRRQAELGWNIADRVRSEDDLWRLGPTPPDDLRRYSVREFIPRTFHTQLESFVTGETAGTSGPPCATAYRADEFDAAFVSPFLRVAEATGFPRGRAWLWVGPSGPHVIGKAVRELARQTGSMDPFSVDFDPRWAKRLADGSMARSRYLEHVIAQAIAVLEREEIGVLFTTPPALTELAKRMTNCQRESIRGVHYGGMTITPASVNEFRAVFPQAVHLAGYGNTLFGVVMEVADGERTAMDYFPLGGRVQFEVVRNGGGGPPLRPFEPVKPGERGRVAFHRLDESALLVNVLERDEAESIPADSAARALGGTTNGLRDPGPPVNSAVQLQLGLY